MINKITDSTVNGYEWIDITAPTEEEFGELARKYSLHPALVNDCLQPDHLPKFERMEKYVFIIFRIYTENDLPEADSIQELTNKIAIFISDQFILTIHRKKQSLFDNVISSLKEKPCAGTKELLNILISSCLNTYEVPLKNYLNPLIILKRLSSFGPRKPHY
jgi:magnesium transporter